jgi:DNA-binding beta-propeller fold protein YncE
MIGAGRAWRACALLAALLAGGCGEVKYLMRVDPEQVPQAAVRVWPGAPETARYRYVGQLIGEDNFVSEEINSRNSGVKLLHWLVGLVGMEEKKIVLKRPQSGMVDAHGRVLVTDVASRAVFVFDQAQGKLQVWEQAREGQTFVTPIGIVAGARDEVLVADAELGLVIRLDRDGKPLGSFGKDILTRPTGLARDPQRGRVYVSDTHAHDVKVFDDSGKLLHTIGGSGEEEGQLNYPTHLAFGGDRLYVADSMNAQVQIYDADGKPVRTLGRRGLAVGQFTRPKGVTLDREGNIYVVESFYDNLLVFDQKGQFLMPLGGTGKEIGQFYLPAGVWSDEQDRIYVADMFNGRVMIFQFLGGG